MSYSPCIISIISNICAPKIGSRTCEEFDSQTDSIRLSAIQAYKGKSVSFTNKKNGKCEEVISSMEAVNTRFLLLLDGTRTIKPQWRWDSEEMVQ